MAATFDATSTSAAVTGATSVTWSHTCSGSDRGLGVGVSSWDASNAHTVSGVTYNGVAMASEGTRLRASSGDRTTIFSLIAPATGANNIVVSLSAAAEVKVGAVSATSVNQTDLMNTYASADGSSNAPSVTATSAADELVFDVVSSFNVTATVGAGQTQRWNEFPGGSTGGCGSTEGGAATVAMSWSLGASAEWCTSAISFKAVAGAADPEGRLKGGKLIRGGLLKGGVLAA